MNKVYANGARLHLSVINGFFKDFVSCSRARTSLLRHQYYMKTVYKYINVE